MIQQAQETVEKMGFTRSLARRFAQMEDITVPNTLFANRDARKAMSENPFDALTATVSEKPKNLSSIQQVSIETFVADVLPTITSLDILLENKHEQNMVSLIAPKHPDAKGMFKWGNNFSWAYSGNITDSMKQKVKALGGATDGVLRFSIQWNTEHDNENDFDAHCIEPDYNEIYFRNKVKVHRSSGILDVDIVQPSDQTPDGVAVENITWSDLSKMPEGTYKLFVHNYRHNGGRSGFTAEVEYDSQIHSFAYNKELKHNEIVQVAEVMYSRKNGFSIIEKIPGSMSSRKLWNLDTNQFHPVSIAMYSPNYWDDQGGQGHKHYFFMLDGCINPESPNGFFNEFLQEDLMKHKHVFEALGSKMRVEDSNNQLSGLGFSSTKPNEIVCRVKGKFERMLKITF
jgi:hypothetical protein